MARGLIVVVAAAAATGAAGCQGSGSAVGKAQAQAKAKPGAPGAALKAAAPKSTAPLSGRVIAIDPGHDGGNGAHPDQINRLVPEGFGQEKACDTTGTNGNDGYTEHAFTLAVSLDLQALLQQRGATVVLTRTTDTGVGPCVDQRAAIGNDAHADAAVSVHADGFDGQGGAGHGYQLLEAERSTGGPAVVAASQRLAEALHDSLDAESGLTPSTYAGSDGYEPVDDIAGLTLSTVPKVLVECGNMRNAGDLAREESAAGQQQMAQAIADGITAYLTGSGVPSNG